MNKIYKILLKALLWLAVSLSIFIIIILLIAEFSARSEFEKLKSENLRLKKEIKNLKDQLSQLWIEKDINDVFFVSIEQNGKQIEIKNNEVVLKKAPFFLILKFKRPNGVSVNASFNSDSFDKTVSGLPFKYIPGFNEGGVADRKFNQDGSVFINEAASNYWYYKNPNDHMCKTVKIDKTGILCKRYISSFSNPKEINITDYPDLKSKTLYLSMIDYMDYKYQEIENQRYYLKVLFR